jgi:hypothetical protein
MCRSQIDCIIRSSEDFSSLQHSFFFCKIWGFHGGDYVENRLLGCGTVWLRFFPTFRRNNPEDDLLFFFVIFLRSHRTTAITLCTYLFYFLHASLLISFCPFARLTAWLSPDNCLFGFFSFVWFSARLYAYVWLLFFLCLPVLSLFLSVL